MICIRARWSVHDGDETVCAKDVFFSLGLQGEDRRQVGSPSSHGC